MWNSLRYPWFWDIGHRAIDPIVLGILRFLWRFARMDVLHSNPGPILILVRLSWWFSMHKSVTFPCCAFKPFLSPCAVGREIDAEIVWILWHYAPHNNLQLNPVGYHTILSACGWFSMHKSVTRNFKSPQEFRSGAFQNGLIVWARQRLKRVSERVEPSLCWGEPRGTLFM